MTRAAGAVNEPHLVLFLLTLEGLNINYGALFTCMMTLGIFFGALFCPHSLVQQKRAQKAKAPTTLRPPRPHRRPPIRYRHHGHGDLATHHDDADFADMLKFVHPICCHKSWIRPPASCSHHDVSRDLQRLL